MAEVESSVWHTEQKTANITEYYVLLKEDLFVIPLIVTYDRSKKEVASAVYTPPDFNYTVHDFCDHENDDCVLDDPDSQENQELDLLDKFRRSVAALEERMQHMRRIERLIADQEKSKNA